MHRRDHRLAGPVPVPWRAGCGSCGSPQGRCTWALEPGGSLKLLALLFVISLMASFIPYVVEQITLRRTTSGAFSVMQSINPAMAVAVGLAFGEIPSVGEIVGVALVICAVIVTFSGDAAPADGQ